MARTARVLHQPAVEMIWHKLPCLAYLFMCFPEDAWTFEDDVYLEFTRTLAPKDWTTFLKYASFVRQLGSELGCSCDRDVSDSAWTTMCSLRPTQILFPHLRSIDWGELPLLRSEKHAPSLLTIVGTSLVKIDLGEPSPRDDDGALQASFGIIAERFPGLRELRCGQYPGLGDPCDTLEIVNAFSTMACRFTSLVSFTSTIFCVTPAAILSLSRLQTLRRLYVCLPDNMAPLSEHPSPHDDAPVLAQLEEVGLYHSTIRAYLAFSQAVTLPHTMKLLLELNHHMHSHLLPKVFSSLSMQCSPDCLTIIDVRDPENGSESEGLLLPAHLRPLLEFKRLESFSLSLSCRYALDDSFCAEMAMAWPCLKHLDIGCARLGRSPRCRHEALPSVRALSPFAVNCPKLEHLGLVFNAMRWENEAGFQADYNRAEIYGALASRASTSTVLSFSPGLSPICGVQYMATFLARVFPSLNTIGHGQITRVDGVWRNMWREVEQLLPMFKLTRQDERLRMAQELAEGPVEIQMASVDD
ncbi:uncharacterized protein TRAVEDRAFT_46628 [Trametes versicolor FP-101664 SS1]|uniref:uncharacterized protein n=1 Tax=Trametes versicolor (strain FP-101664) TaxID=717944 RepID=UPI0004622F78|nr:uncharacterized protein TRAVEDRAFT_46628 [Trametes versicolor FP-101664 SS1]EIW59323.1 hypothetical protein TRAVEDRAFT_46628 [Trametes versicolor FP-101664 SS1]